MHPTILISALLLPLLGIDPQTLRQQLDSVPWRPEVGRVIKPATSPAGTAVATPEIAAVEPPVAAEPVSPAPVTTTPARLDARGTWQLQVAALANPDVAQREQNRLERTLGTGTVTIVVENGLSKLRWGSFPSREAADAARSELKNYRLEGFPVKSNP